MDKTLTELGKLIKPDNTNTGDISYYGQVVSKVIEDSKVVAYNVKVGDSIIEARRTCGADVGDIVLCTTLNNGLTVVSGKLDGDADIEAAQELAQSVVDRADAGEFDGEAGKSAYESAIDGGYTGTEEQFNTDLANISQSASRYITFIDEETGIHVHNEDDLDNYIQMNADEISMYKDNIPTISLTSDDITVGDDSSTHIVITSDSLGFWQNDNTEIMSIDTLETSFRMGGYTWIATDDRLTLWG